MFYMQIYEIFLIAKFQGRSTFQALYLKINGKQVQSIVIRSVSTFDQKIIVFEEQKENFVK